MQFDNSDEPEIVGVKALSCYEVQSTNQRGELLALLSALDYIWASKQPTQVITDSEYIFNAMTKEWYVGWESRDWLTSAYEPVKNSDMWKEIKHAYEKCKSADIDITFYHIKGHCIPFGKVTANTLLHEDPTGAKLFGAMCYKFDSVATLKVDKLREAQELSVKNNGFTLEPDILRKFVVMNSMADAIATKCVDAADSLSKV